MSGALQDLDRAEERECSNAVDLRAQKLDCYRNNCDDMVRNACVLPLLAINQFNPKCIKN